VRRPDFRDYGEALAFYTGKLDFELLEEQPG
jgi:hypothetical protein